MLISSEIWLIVIPLLGGLLLLFPAAHKVIKSVVWLVCSVQVALTSHLTHGVWYNGPTRVLIGGWTAPIGINFYSDGLTAFMLMVTTAIACGISFYALAFYAKQSGFSKQHESSIFWTLWLFLWASLNALFLSADLFNIYIALELISLSGVILATLTEKRDALVAAMRYLLAAFLGSMCYLLGVALLYGMYGTLDIFLIGERIELNATTALAFSTILLGLLIKTALFPLHFWLPPAHSTASSPVSAALSALVIKASFFVLLRLWFVAYNGTIPLAIGQLLGVMGALAIFWGSFQALRQNRLKLLVAHSTVAQVGYLFLLFPLTAFAVTELNHFNYPWISQAWTGTMYQLASHAIAKASMFMAVGIIIYAANTDELSALRGMSRNLPLPTFALSLSGISLIGLPPSGGFIAKWLMLQAVIESGQWWWLPVVLIGGLLTAAYVFLMIGYAFRVPDEVREVRTVSISIQIVTLLLAVLSVVIGFRLVEPFDLLLIGTNFSFTPRLGV